MKTKHLLILTTALIFTMLVSSCKKQYDEGPRFSLRSPEKRLQGHWSVKKYFVDDVDSTQLYKDSCNCDFSVQYEHDDTDYWFLENCIKKSYYGFDWMFPFLFQNDRITWEITTLNFFSIPPMNSLENIEWKVKKLTNKKLILERDVNGIKYRFELES